MRRLTTPSPTGGGFYRNFFATLKTGTAVGSLQRMFITGVSPITMDDVTSGFNIGANISLNPAFNELLGFTEDEVKGVLRMYSDAGALHQEVDAALHTMREWYNGYRFAKGVANDVYNTDMVLYYLKALVLYGSPPEELIDANVRIDYGKLRHLLVTGQRLNGNFDLLRNLIGEGKADANLVGSFPLEGLGRPENFPFADALLRPAQHPSSHRGCAKPGHSQPNRAPTDVRLPARWLRRHRRILRRSLCVRAVDPRHGPERRLAPGH